jgi:hypothetical protein
MNIRKANLRRLQETEVTKNKDDCRASQQHLAGRMWPANRYLNNPGLRNTNILL